MILTKLSEAHPELLSPKDLADRIGEPLGNIAYHVRWLVGRHYIRLHEEVAVRGATQHFYGINDHEMTAALASELECMASILRNDDHGPETPTTTED